MIQNIIKPKILMIIQMLNFNKRISL